MELWRASEHEALGERDWDPAMARAAIEEIVADACGAVRDGRWPGHPLDDLAEDEYVCSLYLGSAGMVWALWQLGAPLDAWGTLDAALAHYRSAPDFGDEAHPPSLWMGET